MNEAVKNGRLDSTLSPEPLLERFVKGAAASLLVLGSLGIAVQTALSLSPRRAMSTVAVEGEDLRVVEQSRPFGFFKQSTANFGAERWTKATHMFAETGAVGDAITFALPAVAAGRYELFVTLTKSRDFGVVQFQVNGEAPGPLVDLWSGPSGGIERTAPLSLGTVALNGRSDRVRVSVRGRNPANLKPYYQFGIDTLWLERK